MDRKMIEEEVRELRERLKELHVENNRLKQRLSDLRKNVQEEADKEKLSGEEELFIRETLYRYAGCWATLKENILEVQLSPSYERGEPQGQYKIFFSTGDRSWTVVGCTLPHNLGTKVQGKSLYSLEELQNYVQEVRRHVQAYTQRKIQVESAEELLNKCQRRGSVWYTISMERVILNIPVTVPGHEFSCNIELRYESDHCLPHSVTADAQGLTQSKLLKLRKRVELQFKKYPLNAILKHEFMEGDDEDDDDYEIQVFKSERSMLSESETS